MFRRGLRVRQVERVRRADVDRVVLVGRRSVRELLVGEGALDSRDFLGGRRRLLAAPADEDRGLAEPGILDNGDGLFAGSPSETDHRDPERFRLQPLPVPVIDALEVIGD